MKPLNISFRVPKTESKDSKVEFWRGEIKRALDFRRYFGDSDAWLGNRDWYRHNFSNVVNYNLVYSSIASEAPSVLFNFPHINVTPLRPGVEAFAYVMEAVDNRLVYQQHLGDECNDILTDIGTCGTGCMVLGYDSQYGYSMKTEGAKETGETFSQYSKKMVKLEYESTIRRGMPWALRTLPDNFLVPWGTSRFSETPWYAFRTSRPIRDVRADEKYIGSARKRIQPSLYGSRINPVVDRNDKGTLPDELQPVYMWQIHDQRSKKTYLLADGCDEFLRIEHDDLQTVLGLPAETISFIKDPVWFWGIPELKYFSGHQAEINEVIEQRRMFRKAAMLRFAYIEGAIDEIEMQKLLGPSPTMGIMVKRAMAGKLDDVIKFFNISIPPDFTELKKDLLEDVKIVSGKGENYMGRQLGKTHITKSETDTAAARAGSRDYKKRETMARFIERIMTKQNELIYRNWSTKRVEQVIGPDMVSYWVEFSGGDIKSDYLLRVAVEDLAPITRETKIQEARELLELFMKDQVFQQMYPDAAMQLRKTLLTQYGWLNFRQFEPKAGVGANPQQPMSLNQFAGQFPEMRKQGENLFAKAG